MEENGFLITGQEAEEENAENNAFNPAEDRPSAPEGAEEAEQTGADAQENQTGGESLAESENMRADDAVRLSDYRANAVRAQDDFNCQNPIIEFRGVYKAYDNGTKALSDVNLKICKGEFVFVVGASGAGKSTFIKLIFREETPNAGEIVVNGYKLSNLKRKYIPKLRRTMGIVYQDFRLIKEMTVFENVAFAMHIVGASARAIRKRVAYTLNIVGLGDKARCYPNELSGGEQQRVGLARALVNNPLIIIADEPTGNVDPNMSYEIVELLSEINRRGTTVIMVTHEHQLVRDFGRRVIMIEHGKIVADNEEASAQ